MSITDELRAVAAKTECANGRCEKLYRGDLDRIADRIDAEHERQLANEWIHGVKYAQSDDAMSKYGYVKLPIDADGVPIHIGDVMAYEDNTKPMEVVALVPPAVFLTEDGPRYADMCRHYHAPTVEDVLREFAEKIIDSQIPGVHPTYEESIAEYASKLQLRGDEE